MQLYHKIGKRKKEGSMQAFGFLLGARKNQMSEDHAERFFSFS
jgi:hypothetical protein